jgi:dihydrofolate synthase/folylpolyglutamate synthase
MSSGTGNNSTAPTPQAPGPQAGLDAWLQFLEALHPVTIELGLERVRAVYERLHLDFSGQQLVIVGGTNGKGSSVAMLAGILRAAGHSVGTYTSPHLIRYNERVGLDGRDATDAELCAAFAAVEAVRAGVSLTYFEYGTLAALQCFAAHKPEFVILEVGLGGRLDAVNIVEPAVSLLTNVDLDHMDWLGDTREKIGFEKAGIFRAGKPAIYGESDMPASVRAQAAKLGTLLLHKGEQYQWQETGESWSWQGCTANGQVIAYQELPRNGFPLDNAAGVLQALQFLATRVQRQHIERGLREAVVPGRFQQLRYRGHDLILDVAHNPHAARYLAQRLEVLARTRRVHLVLGMLGDKDSASVVRLLAPHATQLYAASLGGERGSPAEIIYNHARAAAARAVSTHDSVGAALATALEQASEQDLIVVTGSFFTVAAVLDLVDVEAEC